MSDLTDRVDRVLAMTDDQLQALALRLAGADPALFDRLADRVQEGDGQ